MAKTYRDIATEQMLQTVEEAMCQVINWWGDLPPQMKEAIKQFRTQLGAAIDFRRICQKGTRQRNPRNRRRARPSLNTRKAL